MSASLWNPGGALVTMPATQVAVTDPSGYYVGTDLETVLQELGAASFKAPWYLTKDSPVLMSLRHAVSGNVIMQWQDGSPGTATYLYRGLSIQTDSHSIQMGPATVGGSCDLLWQRSQAHPTDPAGNRFNFTFDEANDRLLLSFATTASGAPAFDSIMQAYAGLSPRLVFPTILAQFNQGVSVKQRATGGFECKFVPVSATQADITDGGTTFLSFSPGKLGVLGAVGSGRITLPAAATDAASTQALANALRAALIAFGFCS